MTKPTADQPSIFLRVTRGLARASAPVGRLMAGQRLLPLWGIVHYQGRKSGRDLSTPVQIRATDDSFVIALPWGDGTQWVRNVMAAGRCTVSWAGSDHEADSPQVLSLEEATAFTHWQRAILGVMRIDQFLRLRRVSAASGGDSAAA